MRLALTHGMHSAITTQSPSHCAAVVGRWQDVMALIAHHDTLYVRWSRSIAADLRRGYSVDHSSGIAHAGLSAVQLNATMDRGTLVDRIMEYSHIGKLQHAPAWLATGHMVGTDTDGAALITDVVPVARLSVALLRRLDVIAKRRRNERLARAGYHFD